MDNMNLSDPELPARPAEKTIVGLYEEMADDKWYWRVLAFLASILIAVGFLIFGGAFMVNDSAQIVPVTIAALVVVNVGYVLSVALWFLRRNWIYQLEHIFVPCLVSSFLGLINTLVVPQLVLGSSSLTAPALASLLVSLVSTLIYGILSAFTWRRIERLRKSTRTPEQTALSYISDDELQRRQMSALLARKEQVTAATLASQRTYHIDMPIPKGRRNMSYDATGTIAGPTSYTL